MNPFLILKLPASATDAEIRRAYLEGVREFPPERDSVRFQAISQAYEQIRDESRRLKYRLFDRTPLGTSPADVLQRYCAAGPLPKPLHFESMKVLLRACLTK